MCTAQPVFVFTIQTISWVIPLFEINDDFIPRCTLDSASKKHLCNGGTYAVLGKIRIRYECVYHRAVYKGRKEGLVDQSIYQSILGVRERGLDSSWAARSLVRWRRGRLQRILVNLLDSGISIY
jgi:hypothetical protein